MNKEKSSNMTLYIVGFGPGSLGGMTYEAMTVLERSQLIVGFKTYVDIIKGYLPDKNYYENGMGGEEARVRHALNEAAKGKVVSIICSGDSSLYGMASLAYELQASDNKYEKVNIIAIAGVSAAFSAGALLGAAVNSDMCTISLSDYHVSFDDILNKVRNAAKGDFVIALYNPRSKARADYLAKVCECLMEILPDDRCCGVAFNIGREGEGCKIMTLKELRDYEADMFTTVVIGSSKTEIINGRMVTKR